jgi:hypothetical protein
MKRALTIVGVFVLALAATTAVVAQSSPFDGTWKLNPAKSKLTSGVLPKEETVTIQMVGGQDQVTLNGCGRLAHFDEIRDAGQGRGGEISSWSLRQCFWKDHQ